VPTKPDPKYAYINRFGWLHEDGLLDLQAVYITIYDHRRPNLTYREGLLAVFLLMRAGMQPKDIALRLQIGRRRAGEMTTKIRRNWQEYDTMLSEETSRP
jgi:hypothetical protein